MERWDRVRIGAAMIASVAVLTTISWFTELVYKAEYPTVPAYEIPDVTEPVVDMAAIQRSWPAGLREPSSRARLIGYMHDIENRPPAILTANTPMIAPAPTPAPDLPTLLASADMEKGRRTARVCASCHTFERGGPDRIGPNLWGVVGRPIAGHSSFAYSPAISAQRGSWTYEQLDRFLASPARVIPGTRMAFSGVRKPEDRASLLIYLGSLNSSPAPLPTATAQNAPSP